MCSPFALHAARKLLERAGDAVAEALAAHARTICVARVGADGDGARADGARVRDAIVAAAYVAAAPAPRASCGDAPPPPTRGLALRFHGTAAFGGGAPSLARSVAAAEGAHVCRWLAKLPPNVLTPAALRGVVEELGAAAGWVVGLVEGCV